MNAIKATIVSLFVVVTALSNAYAKPYSKAKNSDESWLDFNVKNLSTSSLSWKLGKVQAAKTWLDVKKETAQLDPAEDGSSSLLNARLRRYHEQVSWLVGEGNKLSSFGSCFRVTQKEGALTAHCIGTSLPTGVVDVFVFDVSTKQTIAKGQLLNFKLDRPTKDLTRGFSKFEAKLIKVDATTVFNKEIVLVFPGNDSPSIESNFSVEEIPKAEAVYSQFSDNFHRSQLIVRSDVDVAAYFEYSCACKTKLDKVLVQLKKTFDCKSISDTTVCSVFYYKMLDRWFEISRNKLN